MKALHPIPRSDDGLRASASTSARQQLLRPRSGWRIPTRRESTGTRFSEVGEPVGFANSSTALLSVGLARFGCSWSWSREGCLVLSFVYLVVRILFALVCLFGRQRRSKEQILVLRQTALRSVQRPRWGGHKDSLGHPRAARRVDDRARPQRRHHVAAAAAPRARNDHSLVSDGDGVPVTTSVFRATNCATPGLRLRAVASRQSAQPRRAQSVRRP
jgi:hypothetical protein